MMANPSLVRAVVTAVLAATEERMRDDFASACKVARMGAENDIAKRVTAALETSALNHGGIVR
tara:strand:+ start:6477 stop:6665 length:189 start_codon:yes stop_codon:yes gene_type:complete